MARVNKRRGLILSSLLGLLCLLFSVDGFANVYASVDRTQLPQGESLQLTLQSDEPLNHQIPNIDSLSHDFDLLSRAESTQISVLNGKRTVNIQWVFVLVPKHAGIITIPAITMGQNQTQPITITVINGNNQQAPIANKTVFLTATLTPNNPYVQSEALYTLKLYYNAQVANPQLQEPSASLAKVFHVGRDLMYQSSVNGRNYQVIELHFAIVPQNSETIVLAPSQFRGNVLAQNTQGYYGPTWRPIEVNGPTIILHAKAIPDSYNHAWWLPASQVTLSEQYQPALNTIPAGEPVTRIITMTATGTTADNLPNISPDTVTGASVYLDKPVTTTRAVGNNIVSTRVERMVIIPTAAGQLTLPSISVPWFNTQTNQVNDANLPTKTWHVLANPSINNNTNNHLPPPIALTTKTAPSLVNTQPQTQPSHRWQHNRWFWLASIIFLLWIITLTVLWLTRKQVKTLALSPDALPRRQLLAKANGLAQANEAVAFSQVLLGLAHNVWPQAQIHQLSDLKPYLDDVGKQAIDELVQHLYHHDPKPWQGLAAWRILKPQLLKKLMTKHPASTLPPTYPKDDHESRH